MAQYSGSLIESQVDWLTVSAHGQDASQRMLDLAQGLAKEERARGNRERRWRLMGYEGTHVGRVEYGRRDSNSAILRLIGQAAAENLQVALSVSDRVSRLDLASTWRSEPADPQLGRYAYNFAAYHHSKDPHSARPWFTGDADGGYTCYLGSRESDRFLRIYNKEAECRASDDTEGIERYRACWRFELEVKAGLAGTLADAVNDAEDRAAFCRDYLSAYCEAHGIPCPFFRGQRMKLIPGFRRRSDAESKLRHLAKNVRPTLEWFREIGQLEAALNVLGLH